MKTKLVFLLLFTLLVIIVLSYVNFGKGKIQSLISPGHTSGQSTLPSPSPTPKQFKFDSSTNLKQELESVDPKILDSDFEE